MAVENPRRVFDFGARPHANAAAAARYFDRLTRLTVRRDLTPAEWRAYGPARARYVRVCLALAQRTPATPTPVLPPPAGEATSSHRPRARRPRVVLRSSGVELVDDDDRPPGPRLTTPELEALLDILALAMPSYRAMAALTFNADDTPDGWIGLTPAQAAEVCQRTWLRFGPRVEDEAA